MDLTKAEAVSKYLAQAASLKSKRSIEIRTLEGPSNRIIASRLLRSLGAAGIGGSVVEVPTMPTGEMMIECSHEQAALGLALQSAFLGVDIKAQLLVHNKVDSAKVVIYLGSPE
jgi:hypothetical protein